ncbi:MAG: hypothetical protein K0S82_18 [Gaiellaceae bacterium]|jgi:hypothetical protein|nr:hypothetical protein [Gaiellaceae bacterium]
MPNEKRYVIVQASSIEEFAMPSPPTASSDHDPRARLNVSAIREIAKADVVIAMDPSGAAIVVFDSDLEDDQQGAFVTTIYSQPVQWA